MVDTLVLGTSAAGVKVRILSRVHDFNESNFGVYKEEEKKQLRTIGGC